MGEHPHCGAGCSARCGAPARRAIAKPVTEESFVAWYMSTHDTKADKTEPKRPAGVWTPRAANFSPSPWAYRGPQPGF